MKSHNRQSLVAVLVVLFLVWIATLAHAENWVPASDATDIDTDSIRRGSDNLIYYEAGDVYGPYPSAVDCQQRLFYGVGDDGKLGTASSPQPGSETAQELDFICSRA